jgi:hypothetical protein
MPIRAKTSQKCAKEKEMTSIETITGNYRSLAPQPIARLSDISEWSLLRAKIDETLRFAKRLESEESRLATLQELKAFVLKATKTRTDLATERAGIAGWRNRSAPDLAAMLYRFSLNL